MDDPKKYENTVDTFGEYGKVQYVECWLTKALSWNFLVHILCPYQGFQYFWSVPVLHYLQVKLLKFEQFSW